MATYPASVGDSISNAISGAPHLTAMPKIDLNDPESILAVLSKSLEVKMQDHKPIHSRKRYVIGPLLQVGIKVAWIGSQKVRS